MRASMILGGMVLIAPLVGELAHPFAQFQLITVFLLGPIAGIVALVEASKSRAFGPLFALVPVAVGAVLSVRLTFGVPLYVRWQAEPAITAIERWKADHGTYPTEDEAPKLPKNCFYKPEGQSYGILCMGVVFTHCTYEGATQRWRAWD